MEVVVEEPAAEIDVRVALVPVRAVVEARVHDHQHVGEVVGYVRRDHRERRSRRAVGNVRPLLRDAVRLVRAGALSVGAPVARALHDHDEAL